MVLMCSNAFFQVENSTRATQQEITINFDLLDLRGTLHPLSQNDKGMVRAFVFLSTIERAILHLDVDGQIRFWPRC